MKAIAFTGMPGAGKTEAINVAKEMRIKVISMGDEVREEVIKRNLPLSDEITGNIADEMRKKYGLDYWAKRCLSKIKEDFFVIDGIRSMEEVNAFKEKIDELIVVAIHASPATRYERICKRKRYGDEMSIEKFREREKKELAWGLGEVIAMADIVIINEGSLEEFRERVRDILRN
ncbi:MAG: flagellar hook-basal body complex protein FliE [Thermoplasmatales archaeon]|nr:flagellar hook-basal body complex protein FliE [Thermoplasmatales archaeon]